MVRLTDLKKISSSYYHLPNNYIKDSNSVNKLINNKIIGISDGAHYTQSQNVANIYSDKYFEIEDSLYEFDSIVNTLNILEKLILKNDDISKIKIRNIIKNNNFIYSIKGFGASDNEFLEGIDLLV